MQTSNMQELNIKLGTIEQNFNLLFTVSLDFKSSER